MPPIRHPERRLVGDRLAARIDHPRADRRVLGPARNEAPAHAHELALPLGVDAHDRDVRRRGDVVARVHVGRLGEAERQRDRRRMTVQFVAAAHRQSPGVAPGFRASTSSARDRGVVASTLRAVRATCSVSQYAYAPTAAAPASGTHRLADVPARRCVTVKPSDPQHRPQRLRRQLADDRALAGAHDHVAQHLARHVPEQAVQHVRPRELDRAPVQREDVRHQLALDLPDDEEIGQHRQHAQRAGRERQRRRNERRIARGFARDGCRRPVPDRRRAPTRDVGTSAITRSMRPETSCSGVAAGAGREVAFGSSSERVGGRIAGGDPPARGDYPPRRRRVDLPFVVRAVGTMAGPACAGESPDGAAETMRIFGFAGWSGSGKTTLIEQVIPRLVRQGLARVAHQACAPSVRVRPARQGLVSAPACRLQRGAGHVGHALGADARTAWRAGTLARRRHWRGCRPAILPSLKATRPIRSPSSKSGAPRSASRCCIRVIPGSSAIATDSPEALPADTADRMPVFALSDIDAVATFVAARATARSGSQLT